ncbi:MAG: bacteriohopanetetrol glucosamine biosynthesis glycosyltransferase HpnI [Limisphaerales bacterium]
MNFLNAIFAAFALLSFALLLWQFFAARKFPLHKRIANSNFAPAVSILKPLKGCDKTTAASLESWFNQNYTGQIQIFFGVADSNDPVCKIVTELLQKNPNRDAQLIICAENFGANAKVSTLAQLEKSAKHDLILVSDADVRVPPDFLANFVAPLRDEKIGLVNCFYRLANPTTTAMQWEAIAVNADFWSQVLQSQTLKPLDFALGAAILLRRKNLEEIGGFKSLANCLADDYQLGHRIFKNGNSITLCPVVVECWDAPANWSEVWKHQLRWARTIRVCQPPPYFLSILSNATLWPLLWFCVSFAATKSFCASLTAIVFLLIRVCIAQNLQRRFTPDQKLVSPFWLVPVKDLLQAAIWFCAFAGNMVEWRGRKMKLRRDGTLEDGGR